MQERERHARMREDVRDQYTSLMRLALCKRNSLRGHSSGEQGGVTVWPRLSWMPGPRAQASRQRGARPREGWLGPHRRKRKGGTLGEPRRGMGAVALGQAPG